MKLQKAIDHLLDGDALLFTGAGFSLGARNVKGAGFRTARQYARQLSQDLQLPEETSLGDAAEEYSIEHGTDALLAELQDEFTVAVLAPYHTDLAGRPWRRAYTTNYDNVLERAGAESRRIYQPVTLLDHVRRTPKANALCVHLNGFVGRLSRDSILEEIKLTEQSYLTTSVVRSPWTTLFRDDVAAARAVFFVGYSLADLDVSRVLAEVPALREKCFFILGTTCDAATERRASRFGTVLKIGVDTLTEEIRRRASTYVPPEQAEFVGFCVKRVELPTRATMPLRDQDVLDLLLEGRVNRDALWSSVQGGAPYMRERAIVSNVLERESGRARAIIVHSDMGNGKSITLANISLRAIGLGYSVYRVERRSDTLLRELNQILATPGRIMLVLEEYPEWLDVVDHFVKERRDTAVLLVSARTPAHDVTVDRLIERLGDDEIEEYSVDELSEADLRWLDDLLTTYGLWGKLAGSSQAAKARFLDKDCKRSFQGLLVKLLEAPQIAARFEALTTKLGDRRDYYDVTITVLVLTVLQFAPTVDVIADLCGNVVFSTTFRSDAVVRQLINFERGEVVFRSAVAAGFFLQHVADPTIVVDVLTRIAEAADSLRDAVPRYHGLLVMLMRYGRVQTLLPETQRRVMIIRYYESIKNLEGCRKNPLFWLQYAIASLTVDDLDRAGRYFDQAYALAKELERFDSFQIDNHYARYLVQRAILADNVDTCMEGFREARRIVERQTRTDRLHFPFRVASNYASFYNAYESRLGKEEKREVVRAADFVLRRIEDAPPYLRGQRVVVQCRRDMQIILASARPSDRPVD